MKVKFELLGSFLTFFLDTTIMNTHPAAASLRLPFATYLLALCQAINVSAAVIAVTISALVGALLAPDLSLSTMAYGVQFAAVMLATYPMSMWMKRIGRKPAFLLASGFLILAGLIGFLAVSTHNFIGMLVAHACMGVFFAGANFYRFAAVDTLPKALLANGFSWVVAGGVLASLVAPFLTTATREIAGFAEFSWCYGVLVGLGVLNMVLLAFWRAQALATTIEHKNKVRVPLDPEVLWPIRLAIFSVCVSYFVMTLVMVASSLVMRGHYSFEHGAHAIQAHVIAMFAPSFFTGKLISRFGTKSILSIGFVLLVLSAGASYWNDTYPMIFIGLVLLGLGWNFSYIAGGALLAQSAPDEHKNHWQGINDSLIAGFATLAAFLPAPLFASIGWIGINSLSLVLCVGIFLLCHYKLRH